MYIYIYTPYIISYITITYNNHNVFNIMCIHVYIYIYY